MYVGCFVRLGERSGVVVAIEPHVLVSWDDLEVGSADPVDDVAALVSEYRYCPPWWDPITRDYRPGVQLRHALAKRVLKMFGL